MKVSAVLGDFVSTTQRVEEKFKEDDYIGKYILEIFYIADTNRIDKNGDPVYSLYEYVRQNSGEEMSYELGDDVSDLQIEYYDPGHKSSSDNNQVDDEAELQASQLQASYDFYEKNNAGEVANSDAKDSDFIASGGDWVAAAKDNVSLKQIKSKALKISFNVSGDKFSKIYLTDNA
jgi:hypothetical protein